MAIGRDGLTDTTPDGNVKCLESIRGQDQNTIIVFQNPQKNLGKLIIVSGWKTGGIGTWLIFYR
jgi:hypothetical protein